MYIEMIDETGQVSEKLKEQTLELLDFAAQRLGKEDKEMAVTFVTNERSHELNLEYRDTDRPTDVISLEYKPELDISFDEEELAENPELADPVGIERRSRSYRKRICLYGIYPNPKPAKYIRRRRHRAGEQTLYANHQ